VEANRAAQAKLIQLIEDEGEFVSTTGGVVTLDLKSLLEQVTAQLGLPGTLVGKLPEGATSIEIMQSDELSAAQTVVSVLKKLGYVLTALTLLLYAAAIALAGARRRETLRSVGFSFIFIGVVALFVRGAAGNVVVSSLSDVASSDAAVDSVFNIGTSLLLETAQSIVAYGVVIVLAAWLAGPTGVATSARRAITPYLRQPAYAYGGLAVLLMLLFWWDPVIATHRVVPSLLLVLFAVIGTEMLRRQVIREFPDRVTSGSPAGIAQGLAERMRDRARTGLPDRSAGGKLETAGAAAAPADRIGQLERLAELHRAGVLDDEELAQEKALIRG